MDIRYVYIDIVGSKSMSNKQIVTKNQKVIIVIVATALVLMFGQAVPIAQATGSGLKVKVFINDASCIIGSTVDVRVDTSGGSAQFQSVSLQSADSVVTFQFAKGEVAVGESIAVNVRHDGTNIASGNGFNSEASEPEEIDTFVNCVGGGGSSSSSSSSDSSSASSSSSRSAICLIGPC